MKKIYCLSLILLLFAAACSDDKISYSTDDNTATLRLESLTIKLEEPVAQQAPRKTADASVAARTVDTDNFLVKIYRTATGELTNQWTVAEMPSVITLYTGTYRVVVCSGENVSAAWETPYYSAEQEVKLEKNDIKDLDRFVCKLSNVKVTVAYSPALRELLDEQSVVTVKVGEGLLDFSVADADNGKAGYFAAPENRTMSAEFNGIIEGEEVYLPTQLFENVEGGQHREIYFDITSADDLVSKNTGYIKPGLVLNATCESFEKLVSIETSEDVIQDPEAGELGDAPVFSSESVLFGTPNVLSNNSTVAFQVNSATPIVDITVDIISEKLDKITLQEVGLDSHLELAEPGSYEEALKSLGFPTRDEVAGRNEVAFDISQFAPVMIALGSGTHTFEMRASNEAGFRTTRSLILVVE